VLSAVKWAHLVPDDPEKNVRMRIELLEECRTNKTLRAGIRRMCQEDIFFFCKLFVWQHNPKHRGDEVGPFIPWKVQIDWMTQTRAKWQGEGEDALWMKSREVGATWMALIMVLHDCMFFNWKNYLFLSHSEEAVEKSGKKNTLFFKLKFMLDRIPNWLKRGVEKRKLAFNFTHTQSSIEGAATTERSGVGGRNTGIVCDEFSLHPKDFEIFAQTRDTGPRLFIATHYGIARKFNELCRDKDIFKLTMHWLHHPEKYPGAYVYLPSKNKVEILDKDYEFPENYQFVTTGFPRGGPYPCHRSVWYDRECKARKTVRDIAMHLDIDDKGSVEQFFDPLRIREWQATVCREPYWRGHVLADEEGKLTELKAGFDGPFLCWFDFTPEGKPPKGTYKIGCDLSMGVGSTNSSLSVLNARLGEKVAEWSGPFMPPKQLAHIAVALCRFFLDFDGNGAEIVWEKQGPGETFGNEIIRLGYGRCWNPRGGRDALTAEGPPSDKPGWTNTSARLGHLLWHYYDSLKDGSFVNYSKIALEECLNFRVMPDGEIQHGQYVSINDPTGARVNHADRVVADALACLIARGLQYREAPKEQQEVPYGSLAWKRQQARQKADRGWLTRAR
jgi:hypothetical protein